MGYGATGTDENVNLNGEIWDTEFTDLGYDSLALLETAFRISRKYTITLKDDVVIAIRTPRNSIKVVNGGWGHHHLAG